VYKFFLKTLIDAPEHGDVAETCALMSGIPATQQVDGTIEVDEAL
jgi:hypothetical protein